MTVIVLLSTIILFSFLFQNSIKQQMLDWDLLPKSEPITELYFTQPSAIPSTYIPGQPTSIAFTLHNDTHADQTYEYSFTAQAETAPAPIPIVSNSVALTQNETKSITIPYTPTDFGQRVKFNIQLTGIDESNSQNINFWTTKL